MLNMQASTPKGYKTGPDFTDLDDFDISVVSRTIHEFYVHEKRIPAIKAILTKKRETTGYKIHAPSFSNTFKVLGFHWGKMPDNRHILTL
jgi:hypothetical protein